MISLSGCLLGYPLPNHTVQEFLIQKISENDSYDRACCFIEALFEHTLEVLRRLHFEAFCGIHEVTTQFRSPMPMGQSMKGHGRFRKVFYDVVCKAGNTLRLLDVCFFKLGRYC